MTKAAPAPPPPGISACCRAGDDGRGEYCVLRISYPAKSKIDVVRIAYCVSGKVKGRPDVDFAGYGIRYTHYVLRHASRLNGLLSGVLRLYYLADLLVVKR